MVQMAQVSFRPLVTRGVLLTHIVLYHCIHLSRYLWRSVHDQDRLSILNVNQQAFYTIVYVPEMLCDTFSYT